MTRTFSIAPVRKRVVVRVNPVRAFEIFTGAIDAWWPKAYRIGATSPLKQSVIEPFEGGRWLIRCEDGSELRIGTVLKWEPGRRVVFSWEVNAQWKRDPATATEVEVNFIAEGPDTTRVELEHRGFERAGRDAGEQQRSSVDRGWPAVLDAYARLAGGQST
jgi:uncharacterized protein YndB with AHSA1/START domain